MGQAASVKNCFNPAGQITHLQAQLLKGEKGQLATSLGNVYQAALQVESRVFHS